jgi:diguanylate cyclase (GGDEF)-like protein
VPKTRPARMSSSADKPGPQDLVKHTSGLTSRLILAYVEREGGPEAAKDVLRQCGLGDYEKQLRDENHWFDFNTKIRLFEAAAETLDDPDVALHVGAAALDLNVANAVRLALRAFGSPKLVYENVVRASGKFTWAHTWDVLELGSDHARLRYRDAAGVGYHRLDCQYNQGLLSCAPELFGLPPAQIAHTQCAVDGAQACVYDLHWSELGMSVPFVATTVAVASVAGAALLAVLAPSFLPAAAAIPPTVAAHFWRRESYRVRRRAHGLEHEVEEQKDVASRLTTSLHDLVSDLRLDEVLAKITENAQAAVGGKEFVLIMKTGDEVVCRARPGLPRETLATLERWATLTGAVFFTPVILDHLSEVPALADLASHSELPLGSLCSAPLVFKDEHLGTLVALAHGPDAFLPRDVELLESYAAQAAIALSNASLVQRLERLASEDPLTGLFNHREFHEAVDRELERCKRSRGHFSVVLLDVDGLKKVNDQHGHAEGDELLRDIALAIRSVCRTSDLACRIGGDEFAVILPDTNSPEALQVAARLGEELARTKHKPTISFGVAEWPNDGPTKDLLLLRADTALYAGKAGTMRLRDNGGHTTDLLDSP